MADAVVDSNVVYAFRMKRDEWHEQARPIVEGMDGGELPRAHVTNYALTEIITPIQKRAGQAAALETLEFLKKSGGFEISHLAQEDFARGQVLFQRTETVELPDLFTVAYMQRSGIDYIYSFDDDFDRFDGITRLNAATDPFDDPAE